MSNGVLLRNGVVYLIHRTSPFDHALFVPSRHVAYRAERVTLHLRSPYLGLIGANIAAVILVWFGSGWSRLGLTVVAFWICFLWASPLISY